MTFNKTLFSEIVEIVSDVSRTCGPVEESITNKWNELLSRVKKEGFSDLSNSIVVYEPDRDLDSFVKGCALTIIALLVSSPIPRKIFFDYELKLPIDPHDVESSIGCFLRIWNTRAISNNEDIEEAIQLLGGNLEPVLVIADRDYVCHEIDHHNVRVIHSSNY